MVHHLPAAASGPSRGYPREVTAEQGVPPVDNSVNNPVGDPVDNLSLPGATQVRLGLVVPKRHARRAVTRTLVKNQLRAGLRHRLAELAPGDWVLRLRAPIDRQRFPSARSEALAMLLHDEIERLLADAVRRAARAARPVAPSA
jgi:ribonuclease P protein component